MSKNQASILLIASALLMLPGAAAAEPGKGKSGDKVTATAASKGGAVTASSLMKRYENLAGSPTNAESLVKGLRYQLEIVLVGASSTPAAGPTGLSPMGPMGPVCPTCPVPPPPSETVKFVPPTDPMGFGNIDIALALTEAQLDKKDVALPPKPAQLKDALMAVLSLRASGKGWGDVANAMDFELK